MRPDELANLACLRRARDLIDRDYARPLDVPALARAALMSSAHFSRQFRAAYGDVSSEGFRWVTLSPPSQPGLEIVLVEPHAGRPKDDGDALLTLLTKGSLNAVIFRTADVDTAFEKIRASGAEVLQEPTDQPYGVRDCAFRDPSGNMIRINQS